MNFPTLFSRSLSSSKYLAALALIALAIALPPLAQASDASNGQNRVTLCHAPPGNPTNTSEKYISQKAADAHLANHPDDRMGNCQQACYSDAECSDGNTCSVDRCINNRCDYSEHMLGDGPIIEKSIPVRYVELSRNQEEVVPSFQLTRASANGVHMIVETDDLRLEAYTMWLGFFNNPENCTAESTLTDGLRCGAVDLYASAVSGDAANVGANFVYGDGLVATGTKDRFEVCWPANVDDSREKALGNGILTNPLGAEYQTALRFHGPEDERYMPRQVETHNGGCQGFEGTDETGVIEEGYGCGTSQGTGAAVQVPVECTDRQVPGQCPPF